MLHSLIFTKTHTSLESASLFSPGLLAYSGFRLRAETCPDSMKCHPLIVVLVSCHRSLASRRYTSSASLGSSIRRRKRILWARSARLVGHFGCRTAPEKHCLFLYFFRDSLSSCQSLCIVSRPHSTSPPASFSNVPPLISKHLIVILGPTSASSTSL